MIPLIVVVCVAVIVYGLGHVARAVTAPPLDPVPPTFRQRYQRFNVDRSRSHYGLPCADEDCECANQPRARGYAP